MPCFDLEFFEKSSIFAKILKVLSIRVVSNQSKGFDFVNLENI